MELIKEDLLLKEQYFKVASDIIEVLDQATMLNRKQVVVGVCGESGSGKSITALCLLKELQKKDISSVILHQDSYYKLSPKENHLKRKQDISWVGTGELYLDRLQGHINSFKGGAESIMVPVVDYNQDSFSEQRINLQGIQVLIVEGVYAMYLNDTDYSIFMERTYKDTRDDRKNRTRETYDPFVEEVLTIEHELVVSKKNQADLLVSKNYRVVKP